jgi:Tfp pilus assembly protein PilO
MINLTKLTNEIKNIKLLNQLELDSKKIMLIVMVSIAVFYIDFNFIFKAQLKSLDKSRGEIISVKNKLDGFNKDFKSMQDLKSRQALSPQKALPQAKKVILESQFAGLLQDISKTANKNEVRILQLRPLRDTQNAGASQVKAVSGLTPLFILLDLTGGYHNLGKFINDLENLQVFVGVKDLKIAPMEGNYLKQKAGLTLYTYVKK